MKQILIATHHSDVIGLKQTQTKHRDDDTDTKLRCHALGDNYVGIVGKKAANYEMNLHSALLPSL